MASSVLQNYVVSKNWEKSNKLEILKTCRSYCIDHTVDKTYIDLQTCFHQLLWLAISNKGKVADAVWILREVVGESVELISLLADVVASADTETLCIEEPNVRDNYLLLVAAIDAAVPDGVLKERLDPETLEAAGFIANSKLLNQKVVRTKTRLFYKQQKFNLLREESEGYAKLITEMCHDVMPSLKPSYALEQVKSLLGFFNLDPNRVLDILLEAFECQVHREDFFIPLLKMYLESCDMSGFCHLIGFKFQYYHHSVESVTPISLYKITALLLMHDMLRLDDLYPHLKPDDDEICAKDKKLEENAKEEARKLNAVSLAEGQKEEENKEKESSSELDVDNQKFGLCEAMIEIGAWKQSLEFMNRLPAYSLMSVSRVARSLCDLVHCIIDPLYRSKFIPKGAAGKPRISKKGFPESCVQYSQLPDNVFPMLYKLGAFLSVDPVLLVKVVRVSKGFLKDYNVSSDLIKDKLKPVFAGVLNLIDEVLFPSLTLLECNCGVAEELWGLLKRLPYEMRYRLYAQWKNNSYSHHPKLSMARAQTIKKAKYITKRLSKENVKQSGRQIGKLSHSNPCILFDHLLGQIEHYDNFIGPMVDALKYLNPLAYDVLAFCVIEALANPAKQRMKQSDTNLSDWLQSLSQFCGAVFKKYPTEITGLLQYIANQLKAGKSLDLLVLKEVVQKMTGVESNDDITHHQLEALAGGDLLKSEGAYFGQIRNTRKPSQRLRDALMEGNLMIPLCLLIAQQRHAVVYEEEKTRHLKLIGKLYDQCQDNLIQFGGFLTLQLTTHNYQAVLPSLDELHQVYGIQPDVSFFLTRPIYKFEIQNRVSAARAALVQDTTKPQKQKQQELEKSFADTCDDIFRPVVEAVIPLQAPKMWSNLSPLLYVSFWSLSMYDLYSPVERYDLEMTKLETSMKEVDENKEITSNSKKKKEKERCLLLIDKLKEEMQLQLEHNKLIKKWLETRKDAWFPSKLAKGETITQFLQLCIFPRFVFSAIDAIYCAKFIQTIHTLQAPNFSTLICFDRIFSDVSYIVASLTENEASRFGRFLCAMLQMVMRWHGNSKLYEEECAKFPGFLTILRATNSDKASYLDFENFRHVCHKWQYKLTKAVVVCLESKDYTQIRNTILILIKILPHYPQVKNLGQAVERRIEKIIEEEKDKRHDLQVLAIGYNGMLKKKTDMVPENQFHQKEKEKQGDSLKSSKSAQVKQEPVPVKEEAASKTDAPVLRHDREQKVMEESEKAESRKASESPRGDPGIRSVEREKTRARDKDRRDKEKRSRTASPQSGSEDAKKRKADDGGFHSPLIGKKDKKEVKNERKRVTSETEGKDAKRKKDENEVASPTPEHKKKDSMKRSKATDKSSDKEDKLSRKDYKTDIKRDKDGKHRSVKVKER